MTPKERAAMQQVLEALCLIADVAAMEYEYKRWAKAGITALREALSEQAVCKECGTKQAQIDRLMLEYCPDEMTTEQMQEWGNNQRPAEQAEQEPVAWMDSDGWFTRRKSDAILRGGEWTELYAAPVRTKDLTDDEIYKLADDVDWAAGAYLGFARAVIAADREKNK